MGNRGRDPAALLPIAGRCDGAIMPSQSCFSFTSRLSHRPNLGTVPHFLGHGNIGNWPKRGHIDSRQEVRMPCLLEFFMRARPRDSHSKMIGSIRSRRTLERDLSVWGSQHMSRVCAWHLPCSVAITCSHRSDFQGRMTIHARCRIGSLYWATTKCLQHDWTS
jgi:hypothetical protein